jgi:hypothetical protein
MINLKEYNERELSLIVFNTESLYNLKDNEPALITKLQSRYIYSKKQLSILLKDIEDYKLEFNRYKFVI